MHLKKENANQMMGVLVLLHQMMGVLVLPTPFGHITTPFYGPGSMVAGA
jgi:hypothetical protein